MEKIKISKADYQRLQEHRKFLSNMNAAYFTMEMDPFSLDWVMDNGMAERLLGISAEQAIAFGKVITQQVKEGADYDESVVDQVEFFLNNPKGKWSGVFRLLNFSNDGNWLIYSSTPLNWDESGTVSRIAVAALVIDDIFDTPRTLGSFKDYIVEQVMHKDVESLTDKQRQVLLLIAQNKSRTEIAQEMNISPYTVDDHKRAITKKFKLGSSKELVGLSQYLGFK